MVRPVWLEMKLAAQCSSPIGGPPEGPLQWESHRRGALSGRSGEGLGRESEVVLDPRSCSEVGRCCPKMQATPTTTLVTAMSTRCASSTCVAQRCKSVATIDVQHRCPTELYRSKPPGHAMAQRCLLNTYSPPHNTYSPPHNTNFNQLRGNQTTPTSLAAGCGHSLELPFHQPFHGRGVARWIEVLATAMATAMAFAPLRSASRELSLELSLDSSCFAPLRESSL